MCDYKEINIKNPMFSESLDLLNSEIIRVIEKVYEGEFKSGEVTLKLNISMVEDFKEFPVIDELGFKDNKTVFFNKPVIEHNVNTTLKKQYKEKGLISPDSEIKKTDKGDFILVPVKETQLDLLKDGFLK